MFCILGMLTFVRKVSVQKEVRNTDLWITLKKLQSNKNFAEIEIDMGYIGGLRKSLCLITSRIQRKVVESESTRVNRQKKSAIMAVCGAQLARVDVSRRNIENLNYERDCLFYFFPRVLTASA